MKRRLMQMNRYFLTVFLIAAVLFPRPGFTARPMFQGGADPEGGVIRINERRAGIIDNNDDVDVYQFRGFAGESVHIEVNATTGSLDPAVTVFYDASRLLQPTPTPTPTPFGSGLPIITESFETTPAQASVFVNIDTPANNSTIPIPTNPSTIQLTGRAGVTGGTTPTNLEIAIVIDVSGSLDSTEYELEAAGVREILKALDPDNDGQLSSSVALIQFDDTGRIVVPLTRSRAQVEGGLGRTGSGGTHYNNAMTKALEALAPSSPTDSTAELVLFFSDGAPNSGTYTAPGGGGPLDQFQPRGIRMDTFGIGSGVSPSILQQMAMAAGGTYTAIPTFNDVPRVTASLPGVVGLSSVMLDCNGDGIAEITANVAVDGSYTAVVPIRVGPNTCTAIARATDQALQPAMETVNFFGQLAPRVGNNLQVVHDDDSGPGSHALINVLQLPLTGLYTIVVSSSRSLSSGGYELVLTPVDEDSNAAAASRTNGTVTVFSTQTTNQTIFTIGDAASPATFEIFSPDGKSAAASRTSGSLTIFGTQAANQTIFTIGDAASPATFLGFAPDGKSGAASRTSGVVTVFGAQSPGQTIFTIGDAASPATFLGFAPDGKSAAAARTNGAVTVFSTQSPGQSIFTIGDAASPASFQGFAPDGKSAAVARTNGTVTVFSTQSLGQTLFTIGDAASPATFQGFSPDGFFAAASRTNGTVTVFSAQNTGQTIFTIGDAASPATFQGFAPDGKSAAAARTNGTVSLLSTVNVGQTIFTIGDAASPATFQGFSPVGKSAVASRTNGTVTLFSTQMSNQVFFTIGDAASPATFRGYSPDGTAAAATRTNGTMTVFSTLTAGQTLFTLGDAASPASFPEFSPNGQVGVATRTNGSLTVFSAKNAGQTIFTIGDSSSPATFRGFSPDGKTGAASRTNGTVTVFSTQTNNQTIFTIGDAASPATFLGFSPDGMSAVASRTNGTVTVFSTQTVNQTIYTIGDAASPASFLGFAPDGHASAVSRTNGTVTVFSTLNVNQTFSTIGDAASPATFVMFALDSDTSVASRTNGTVTMSSTRTTNQTIFSIGDAASQATFRGYSFDRTSSGGGTPTGCEPQLMPSAALLPANGGTSSFDVSIGAGCTWAATSLDTWIEITGTPGATGGGMVNFRVAANQNAGERIGLIMVGEKAFAVIQPGGSSCTYQLSPANQQAGANGGSFNVNVTTQQGCFWTASSQQEWVGIPGSGGSGSGAFSYTLSANTGFTQRNASIAVGNQAIQVSQAGGSSCVFTLVPNTKSIPTQGSSESFNVQTTSGCFWTANTQDSWISISSGRTGNGNGTVAFQASANPSNFTRVGEILVGDVVFLAPQASAACPIIPILVGDIVNETLSRSDCLTVYGGVYFADRYSIELTAGQQIAVLMSSADFDTYLYLETPDGNLLFNDDGAGRTDARIPAGASYFTAPTTGTYLISAESFFEEEVGAYTLEILAPSNCTYQLTPTTQNFTTAGGNGTLNVATQSNCRWRATTRDGWIRITSGANGTGNGAVGFTVAQNGSSGPRTGRIAIDNQTFTVTQAGTLAAGGGTEITILIDDGTAESGGLGDNLMIVNRLTPPGYPFRLTRIRIFLAQFQGFPSPVGATIRLIAFAATGGQPPNNPAFAVNQLVTIPQIPVNGAFVDFDVPTGPTILSGDIYVGFQSPAPVGGVVHAADTNGFQQMRGFFSLDNGQTFAGPLVLGQTQTPANIMIRAVGNVGGCSYTISESTRIFGSSGGSGTINVTAPQGCTWTVTINDPWITPTTPTQGTGNGSFGYTVSGNSSAASRKGGIVIGSETQDIKQGNPGRCPAVTNVTPGSAAIGSRVIITGTDFLRVTGVRFAGNVFAPHLVLSDTQISVVVPPNAINGPITILRPGCNDAQTSTFTVQQPSVCPTVSNINPSAGLVGSSVTITGSNFTGVTSVRFGGNVPAQFTVLNDSTISATAPAGAQSGPVTISKSGCADAQTPVFTVQTPQLCPTVSNINPASGAVGASVTISGSNFTGVTSVRFGGNVSAQFTVVNDATISTTVPSGAQSGGITLSKPNCSDATTSTFTVTTTGGARTVRAGSSSGSPGGTVVVPIELISLGDENALGFSITFDPAVLSNPQAVAGADAISAALTINALQAAQGRVGLQLGLPTNQRFTAGTRSIANITFTIAAGASGTTPIGFGDTPIFREISDTTANPLPATYQSGQVTVATGFEGDVAPRPNGNGALTTTDWVQVGRFTAGVDTATAGSEFQRADVAPRGALGDGRLTTIDYVQAGRYAAGLDPLTSAGGPTAPTPFTLSSPPLVVRSGASRSDQARTLRVVNSAIARGQQGTVTIELDAVGDENALGFSLSFDPTQIQYVDAASGSDTTNATININSTQADAGRIGLLLALQPGQSFSAGTRRIAVITFTATAGGAGSSTAISFADQPVFREVSDVAANALPANYTSGSVTLGRSVATVSAANFVGGNIADESIAAAFGSDLATRTEAATTTPLPDDLAGTTVTVRDANGVDRRAALFFVSAMQINFQIPPGTLDGPASITVRSGDGAVSVGAIQIQRVAPGIFTANIDVTGLAAAQIFRLKGDGAQSFEEVAQFDPGQGRFVPIPIDLGPESDQVFLVLYGTGIRYRSDLSAVTATVGGSAAAVLFAGAQGGFVGLDQINLPLSRSLIGRGEITVMLTVNGIDANAVKITMK
ncbi:MAG: VWA domain-containing protein [Acidobacteria bacterium]|nr:VWA domain-containing protein [Acidobacteriota bacterium]